MRWEREPGRGAYARPERERRFLLREGPPPGRDGRLVEDRYLDGTRLRLRRVSGDGRSVHKLTQKVRVRDDDPADVLLTNTYLSAEEHALLSALPGRTLTKTRSTHPLADLDLVVDVFQGRWLGLRLAEVEVADLRRALVLPDWVGQEVTHDDRFSGGALAAAGDDEVRALLAEAQPPT